MIAWHLTAYESVTEYEDKMNITSNSIHGEQYRAKSKMTIE